MNYHKKTFATQKKVFLNNLLEHQGDEPRTDDITVIGFRI
jgi:serine phosphatase RsbU (regulator of sigma subunit)